MSLKRHIRTRCLEALWKETVNCFSREDLGLRELYGFAAPDLPDTKDPRIYPFALMPMEDIAPRQINISPAPLLFQQGISAISDTTYDFELTFIFPAKLFRHVLGSNSYLDEIAELRTWLFSGGSVPNKNGRLQDPDLPGQLINNLIVKWQEQPARYAAGSAGVEVPIIIGFETRENAAGDRQ